MPQTIARPPTVRSQPAGRILSYLAEALQVSPADLNGCAIDLSASCSSVTPQTDQYRVPSQQDLIILSLQGYVRMPTLNSEPTAILTFLNPDPSERIFIKTQNCLLKLENIDRSLKVFDNRDIPLHTVTPPFGAPLSWPLEMPFSVPGGHTLKATFTLQDSTTAIVGNASTYGIVLTGAFIPHDLLKNLQR